MLCVGLSVKITVDLDGVNLDDSFKGLKKNLISVSGKKLTQFLKNNSPNDKGRLANSWKVSNKTENSTTVSTDVPYANYPNDGTGVFGKRGSPITPKSPNGVMVFEKNGKTIFTRKVQGQKGQKFVEKSIKDLENIIPLIVTSKE